MRNSPRADRKSGGLSASSAGGEARKRSPAVRRRAALAGVDSKPVAFMFASLKAISSILHAISGNKPRFQIVFPGHPIQLSEIDQVDWDSFGALLGRPRWSHSPESLRSRDLLSARWSALTSRMVTTRPQSLA